MALSATKTLTLLTITAAIAAVALLAVDRGEDAFTNPGRALGAALSSPSPLGRALHDDHVHDDEYETTNTTQHRLWTLKCGQCETSTSIIIPLFFLAWNSAMSQAMIMAVIIPLSFGRCRDVQWILVIFPHWYAGLIMPMYLAGLIGTISYLPYVLGFYLAAKKGLLGCCPPKIATEREMASAVDKDGVRIQPGDEVEVRVGTSWKKATLVCMRAEDQTWRACIDGKTMPSQPWLPGYARATIRQVGSGPPCEKAAATSSAAQAKRIRELEEQVQSLARWQQQQQQRLQPGPFVPVVPVAEAAFVPTTRHGAVPIPLGVAAPPVGSDVV